MKINIARLGTIDFEKAQIIQKKLLDLRSAHIIDDTFLILQHNPVFTIGKYGNKANVLVSEEYLLSKKIKIYHIDRGGDVTYHGQGQIVGYPVVNLKEKSMDLKTYIWSLQEIVIRILNEQFNISATRQWGKYTGVWVNNDKIAAIGITIRKFITMHGFAFNINTDLQPFNWIIPCGLKERGVTSIKNICKKKIEIEDIMRLIEANFMEIFKYNQVNYLNIDELMELTRDDET